MPNILAHYKNGNYEVTLWDDGTKIRGTKDDEFIPEFPECIDITISNYCNHNCKYCYADCSIAGKHADLKSLEPLLDTIHSGTEIAININGGENPKDLIPFLEHMKDRNVIVNATIRQDDFEKYEKQLFELTYKDLIHGLGVSLLDPAPGFILKAINYPNLVIHCINGIITPEQFADLADHDLRILILGYKNTGRGIDYAEADNELIKWKSKWLYDHLGDYLHRFRVVSFDNLALEQLNVRRFVSKARWNALYQGDEGTSTFFLNLADGYYARDSTTNQYYWPLMSTVDDMFHIIRDEASFEND